MSESHGRTMAQLMRARSARLALVLALLAGGLVVWAAPRPRFFGVATIVSAYVAFWNAFVFVSLLRLHAFRPGTSLVPGLRSRSSAHALGLGVAISSVPVLAALITGASVSTMAPLALAGFALGWALAPLLPGNQKMLVLGLGLGVATGLTAVLYDEKLAPGPEGKPWAWPGFLDPVWQQLSLGVLAMAGIVVATRRIAGVREDAWFMRPESSSTSDDCGTDTCGGSIPPAVLDLLPGFARRRLPRRENGRTSEAQLQRSLFRYSLMAVSPTGLAVLYLPFVLILGWIGLQDSDPGSLFWNPNLFVLNGIIMIFATLTPGRMQRELLRPASRKELVARLTDALRTDTVIFVGLLLLGTAALHLLMIRERMETMGYWLHYLMSPGLAVFAFGLTLSLSVWTRRAGLLAFVPAWFLSAVASTRIEDGSRSVEAMIWIAVSVALGVLGMGLVRRGRRLWTTADLN